MINLGTNDWGHVVPLSTNNRGHVVPLSTDDRGHVVPLSTNDRGHVVPLSTNDRGHVVPLSTNVSKTFNNTAVFLSPAAFVCTCGQQPQGSRSAATHNRPFELISHDRSCRCVCCVGVSRLCRGAGQASQRSRACPFFLVMGPILYIHNAPTRCMHAIISAANAKGILTYAVPVVTPVERCGHLPYDTYARD